jgi:hypothetical protein
MVGSYLRFEEPGYYLLQFNISNLIVLRNFDTNPTIQHHNVKDGSRNIQR